MKPKKLVQSKNLSGLNGVRDVTLGSATPERRQQRDFSKSGIEQPQKSFDDWDEKMKRWSQLS